MKFNPNRDNLDCYVWVGDPHVKKTNIEESYRLIRWIDKEAQKRNAPVVFAGDQYNDFGVARVEAVQFWSNAFNEMNSKVIAIVGNHDANSDVSLNFMDIHKHQVLVVDKPIIIDGVLLLPFFRKNELFIKAMEEAFGATEVFCHQEFNGCQYENGFYSPHGVDPELIPSHIKQITSGHIHKNQEFGKIWYPGTARHLTRSDIGEKKGVFFVNRKAGTREFIPTPKEVSEPFVSIDITPDHTPELPNTESSRVFVNIKGPKDFIKKTLKSIPEGFKVRTFPESNATEVKVKESEGIPKAFLSFALEYANKNGLGNNEFKAILNQVYDKCAFLKGN